MSLDIRLALEDLGIDLLTWAVHFGNLNPHFAKCQDCADFKNDVCPGDMKPIECFTSDRHKMTWETI